MARDSAVIRKLVGELNVVENTKGCESLEFEEIFKKLTEAFYPPARLNVSTGPQTNHHREGVVPTTPYRKRPDSREV